MESTLKNMVVVLGSITLIAGAAVGGIYQLTKDPIAAAQTKKINDAIAQVMPQFDNTPSEEVTEQEIDGGIVKIYPATKDGEAVGYAVETFTKNGFGGAISLMVGFLPDGTIQDISVISQNETPGLGDKIQKSKSDFIETRFMGKNPSDPNFKLAVTKDGGSVDAITASTISSRAFCDAVARAYGVFQQVVNGEAVEAVSGATSTHAGGGQDYDTQKSDTTAKADKKGDDFEFDPSAVKGAAIPCEAVSGATASVKAEEHKEKAKDSVKTAPMKGGKTL